MNEQVKKVNFSKAANIVLFFLSGFQWLFAIILMISLETVRNSDVLSDLGSFFYGRHSIFMSLWAMFSPFIAFAFLAIALVLFFLKKMNWVSLLILAAINIGYFFAGSYYVWGYFGR